MKIKTQEMKLQTGFLFNTIDSLNYKRTGDFLHTHYQCIMEIRI